MIAGSGFLNTSVLVYAFSRDDKAPAAQALLAVARRNLRLSWHETLEAIAALETLCRSVVPLDIAVHDDGLRRAVRHGFAIYDAMIVAAALRARCTTPWSEDLHHGLLVEDRLRIGNPFIPAP